MFRATLICFLFFSRYDFVKKKLTEPVERMKINKISHFIVLFYQRIQSPLTLNYTYLLSCSTCTHRRSVTSGSAGRRRIVPPLDKHFFFLHNQNTSGKTRILNSIAEKRRNI